VENVKYNYQPYIFKVLPLLLLLVSCETSSLPLEYQLQGETMGTQYHIRIPLATQKEAAQTVSKQQLQQQIEALLDSINREMSTYLTTSRISRFNQSQQQNWFPVSSSFLQVVNAAQQISQSSQGAFDITIMPLVNLWGFAKNKNKQIPKQQQINQALNKTGYQFLQTQQQPPAIRKQKQALSIDLSAIAKGYAVDAIALLLKKYHFKNFLVEIGGEIRLRGHNKHGQAWRIAIEKPNPFNRTAQQGLKLHNIAIATSGDYRNYYQKNGVRYSHTINPQTGKPITHKLASVTVLHQSAMIADAQATAIMVLGENKGKAYAQRENLKVYMIYRDKGKFSIWHNLPNNLLIPH